MQTMNIAISQVPEVDAVACGSFKTSNEDQIKAIGYVVSSMEAALWAFYHTDNFKDGCLKVGRHRLLCVCVF